MSEQRFPSLSHWGAFTAVVENGRLVRCEPFAKDPSPSAIIDSMPEMVHSPLRIKRPAIREGWLKHRDTTQRGRDRYIEVSWDEALKLVAEELQRVRATAGDAAIFGGSYGWSSAGRLHHARTQTHRFLNAGGGFTSQAGNYSWGSAQFFLPHVIGSYAPVTGRVTDWNSILDHTRLMVAFGGLPVRNTQITSGGAGQHLLPSWLERAQQRNIEFVVISPNRADIPDGLRARWIPIRPHTDTAMMLALMHTLLVEGLADRDFLTRCCVGFEVLEPYLLGESDGCVKHAAWASQLCGVEVSTIISLAREMAGTRSFITCAWSLQRAHRGEQPYWASIALAATLGQIGLPGGGFAFGHASMNGVGNPRMSNLPAPEMASGRNPANSVIPVARIAEMLLKPGQSFQFNGKEGVYPDIRLVYWAGGNPYHHHQDLNRFERAWQKPETVIVHDSWWTATVRRADIVLPATTTLERNDVGGSSRDRFVLAMHQALPPQAQARNDFDIYQELASRLGFESRFTEDKNERQWLEQIYGGVERAWREQGLAMPDFNAFWEQGYVESPEPAERFVLFEDFCADPEQHPLKTPSGKIELFSNTIAGFGYADMRGHPEWSPPQEWLGAPQAKRYPLHLLTFQPPDKLHGQFDPSQPSRRHKKNGRQQVYLSAQDARARGLKTDDAVVLFNDRGQCLGSLVVSEDLMPGTAAMPTGAWFDPQGETLERHGNPNVLTLDIPTSTLTQGTSAQTTLVDIRKWEGELPRVEVFDLPPGVAVA